jgi:hypothetical protein
MTDDSEPIRDCSKVLCPAIFKTKILGVTEGPRIPTCFPGSRTENPVLAVDIGELQLGVATPGCLEAREPSASSKASIFMQTVSKRGEQYSNRVLSWCC